MIEKTWCQFLAGRKCQPDEWVVMDTVKGLNLSVVGEKMDPDVSVQGHIAHPNLLTQFIYQYFLVSRGSLCWQTDCSYVSALNLFMFFLSLAHTYTFQVIRMMSYWCDTLNQIFYLSRCRDEQSKDQLALIVHQCRKQPSEAFSSRLPLKRIGRTLQKVTRNWLELR